MTSSTISDYGQFTHLGKGISPTDDQRLHTHNTEYKFNPFDYQNVSNYQFDEAVKRVEKRTNDVVRGLVTDSRYDIWFSNIIPLEKLEGLVVSWNVWTLDTPDPESTPYEAPVTFTSSRKQEQHDSIERRGKGFKMELDYLSTEEGQTMLTWQLQIIAQGIKRWMAYDTVYALLNCNKYKELVQMKFGHLQVPASRIIENEIESFAALAKNWKKVDSIIEMAKATLRRNEVTPDTLIIPEEMAMFFKFGHDERIFAQYAGPNGPVDYVKDPDLLGELRGLVAVKANFNTIHGQNKLAPNPLERRVRVGEYYEMFPKNRDSPLSRYLSKERDAYLFSHTIDDQKKIFFKDSLQHTHVWDLSGERAYSEHVYKDIARLNAMRKKVPPANSNLIYNDQGAYKQAKIWYGKEGCPNSLATIDDDNETWLPAEYFGQLMPWAMEKKDIQRMAESVLSHVINPSDLSKVQGYFNDLLFVIDGIQNQEYSENYWSELRNLNIRRQLNTQGQFIGEMTPVFSSPFMGEHPVVREWKPNTFGSMDFPQIPLTDKRMQGVHFPAGFDNGPGLIALEAEADRPNSPWRDHGKRISPAMKILRQVAQVLREVLPSSLAIRDDSRSPWFHKADPLAILLDCTLPLNGDPIFLSDARLEGEFGSSKPDNVEEGRIYYFPLPLYPMRPTDQDTLAKVIPDLQPADRTRDPTIVVYNNPLTGATYGVLTLGFNTEDLPPYLLVYSVVGGNAAEMYDQILDKITEAKADLDERIELANSLARKLLKKFSKTYDAAHVIRIISSDVADDPAHDIEAAITRFTGITTKPELDAYLKRIPKSNEKAAPRMDLSNYPAKQPLGGANLWSKITQEYNYLSTNMKPTVTIPMPTLSNASREAVLRLINLLTPNLFIEDGEVARRLVLLKQYLQDYSESMNDKQKVILDTQRKYSSNYWRAPLTMSFALLKSIQFLPAAVIKPGNPGTNFQTPIEASDTDNGVLPTSEWRRSPYTTLNEKIASRVGDGLYAFSNMKYLEGKKEVKQTKKSTPAPTKMDVSSGFEDYMGESDYEGSSYNKRFKGTIGAIGNDDDTYENDDMEDFTRRKNKSAFYRIDEDTVESKRLLTNVLKFRFRQIESDPVIMRMIEHALMVLDIKWPVVSAMIDKNIYVPFGVVNWRDIEHGMFSAIILKKGDTTGNNYWNRSNFMMQPNADVKTVSASFTFHAKCIIRNPANVYVLEDIMPSRYLGGCGTRYFTSPREYSEMADRGPDAPSIFCTLHPVTETELPMHCSLEGKLPVSEMNPTLDSTISHYFNADFYNSMMQLSLKSRTNAANSSFSDWDERRNTTFQPGHMFTWSYEKNLFCVFRPSKGHRGVNGNFRGCSKVWNGEHICFPKPDLNEYILD